MSNTDTPRYWLDTKAIEPATEALGEYENRLEKAAHNIALAGHCDELCEAQIAAILRAAFPPPAAAGEGAVRPTLCDAMAILHELRWRFDYEINDSNDPYLVMQRTGADLKPENVEIGDDDCGVWVDGRIYTTLDALRTRLTALSKFTGREGGH